MNTELFRTINNLAGQNGWLDSFMIFSADRLGYLMIGVLVLLYVKNRVKFKDMVYTALGSAIIARFFIVSAVRYLYYHPRPFMALQDVRHLMDNDSTSSFPSGHASFYFALAMGVYLYNKKAGIICFVLAGLIGFARIFIGVHWPLDIVAGAVLGAMVAWGMRQFNSFRA